GSANESLAAYLSGVKDTTADSTNKTAIASNDTAASAAKKAAGSDTASLSGLLNNKSTAATTNSGTATTDSAKLKEQEAKNKYPLSALIIPNASQEEGYFPSPVVGFVSKRDTAKVN